MTEDTVLRPRGMTSIPHMNAIGYTIAAGIAIALLPLLPFLVAMYLLGKRWSSRPEVRFDGDTAR